MDMDADLNDVFFFALVSELGSFSAAAREAGVPVSTVSRRIARLEERLGVTLMTRTTRKLSLTDAGRGYQDHARRAVDEIEAAERMVHDLGSRPSGRVRLTTSMGIARIVWPSISEFLELHPDVRVELDAREHRVDLVEEGYDLAVRAGELPDSTLVARKLFDATRQLFASPAYLARRRRPRRVVDLAHHDCVLMGIGAPRAPWVLRQRGRRLRVVVSGRIRVNEMGLAHQACLDGCGIALLPVKLSAADVAAGRLERVLPSVDGGSSPLWIVHPAGRRLPSAVRALADHLVARVPALFHDQRGGA
ncbi:MAG TPA: LysR family transcriptional regulator [Kofleriaceae bacterium]|nr:LysR family transcriptional regulator [Kofleriaceae bacterium]